MPTTAPRVSVIIPAYNVADFIGETVASVLGQTYGNYEVIVVNDGSPDTPRLEAAIAGYRDRIVYLVKENGGVSSARNAGIRAARGDLVAFLDGDDVWEPNYLEVQVGTLDRDPSAAAVYPDALYFGDGPLPGRTFQTVYPSDGEVTIPAVWRARVHIPSSLTARREAVLKAGLFDETLAHCEDLDCWLRMLGTGGRIVYHRQALYRYRQHARSVSRDVIKMLEGKLRVAEKCLANMTRDDAARDAVLAAQRTLTAELNREKGRLAFLAGDTGEALRRLRAANGTLRSRKLAVVIGALRVAPGVLRRLHEWRDRRLAG